MATTKKAPITPGATVTHYQEKADEVRKHLEAAREAIPVIDIPADMTLDSGVKGLKDSFIATAVGMYDGSPDLQTVPAIDLTDARDTLQYMDAFRPLILELQTQIRQIKLQFKARKKQAVESALLVYQLAKTVQRATPGVDLNAHIGSLKSQLPRRKKVKAATSPKTPAPTSSTSSTPVTPATPAPVDPAKTGK
jgi:hypothetical protein